eukprot:RCo030922
MEPEFTLNVRVVSISSLPLPNSSPVLAADVSFCSEHRKSAFKPRPTREWNEDFAFPIPNPKKMPRQVLTVEIFQQPQQHKGRPTVCQFDLHDPHRIPVNTPKSFVMHSAGAQLVLQVTVDDPSGASSARTSTSIPKEVVEAPSEVHEPEVSVSASRPSRRSQRRRSFTAAISEQETEQRREIEASADDERRLLCAVAAVSKDELINEANQTTPEGMLKAAVARECLARGAMCREQAESWEALEQECRDGAAAIQAAQDA